MKNYNVTKLLILLLLILLFVPIYIDYFQVCDPFGLKKLLFSFVIHLFGSKFEMWNFIGILITALAIVIPLVFQIEDKAKNKSDENSQLLNALIVELNSNMNTAFLNGFEVEFQTEAFDSLCKKSDLIKDFDLFEKLSRIYSFIKYFENISLRNSSNQILLSEKLTWLQINFIWILREIPKNKIDVHSKFNNVVGIKLNHPEEFYQKSKALLYLVSNSQTHKDRIVEIINSNSVENAFNKIKDIVYEYFRMNLSIKYKKRITKNIRIRILNMFKSR